MLFTSSNEAQNMLYFFMLFYDYHHTSDSVNYTPLNIPRLRRIYNQKSFFQNLITIPMFILIAAVALSFFIKTAHPNGEYVQADAENIHPTVIPSPTISIQSVLSEQHHVAPSSALEQVVEDALNGTKGLYGIAIRNIKTGESYYKNEHQKFQSASLYKVWIMAVVYKQIAEGKLSLDDTLSGDIADLNRRFDIATESAELTEGSVTFTVSNALEEMITNSHNYAALLLTAKVGLSNVANFLEANGLHDSNIGQPPLTTPSDMAIFFEKLYRGELNDAPHSIEMIQLLKRQNLNNIIPKYLPEEIEIAHKTGQIYSVAHDAGIIFSIKGDYIFVGMSDSNFYPDAEDRIARVSESVYNYFQQTRDLEK